MRNELYDFANQLNNMFYRNGGYKSFPIDCVALDGEYKVYADNDALNYAYDAGLDKIRLEKDSRLTIDIGVTAQVEAILNFDK